MKKYAIPDDPISLESIEDLDILYLIGTARNGIGYHRFTSLTKTFPFSLSDWSGFLHISERTIQRYQKQVKAFDPVASERIIEIALLYKHAIGVFGSKNKLDAWLDTQSVAFGGIKPKNLMDSSMGLQLIRNELVRIEHGILA